jgi:hypothetical protein
MEPKTSCSLIYSLLSNFRLTGPTTRRKIKIQDLTLSLSTVRSFPLTEINHQAPMEGFGNLLQRRKRHVGMIQTFDPCDELLRGA